MLFGEELRVDGRLPAGFWVGVAMRATLIGLLLLPLLRPGLEQYEGKGMGWRVLVYLLAGAVIPFLWHRAGARPPYPYLADNLLILAPLTDVLWNTLDAYDRVWWWDDVNHLLYAMVFAAVIGLLVGRYPLAALVRFGLAVGLGTTLLVLWEIGEYAVIVAELSGTENPYEDTIGDLAFGFVGTIFGAAFALQAVRAADQEVAARSAR